MSTTSADMNFLLYSGLFYTWLQGSGLGRQVLTRASGWDFRFGRGGRGQVQGTCLGLFIHQETPRNAESLLEGSQVLGFRDQLQTRKPKLNFNPQTLN